MKKTVLLGFLALCMSQAFAWEDTNLTVDYIDVKGDGSASVYFTTPANVPKPSSCPPVDGIQYTVQSGTVSWEGSNKSANNFLSTFLAAKLGSKNVQVIVDNSACLWGAWPKLLVVRIK